MWIYKGEEITEIQQVPEGAIGFVYHIVTSEGREYIGKKNLYSTKNKEMAESTWRKLKKEGAEGLHKTKNKKKSKKGSPVWRYKQEVVKESDWKTYTSSNDDLNEDIKKGVTITKYIIDFAFEKQQLSYLEEKNLWCNGVLEHGDKYYNSNISGRYFKSKV